MRLLLSSRCSVLEITSRIAVKENEDGNSIIKGGTTMAKQLSEQLADLSVHAKRAEDTLAAAQKETHDKIMSRWEQARADATATTENVNQQIQSVGDSIAKDWNARK